MARLSHAPNNGVARVSSIFSRRATIASSVNTAAKDLEITRLRKLNQRLKKRLTKYEDMFKSLKQVWDLHEISDDDLDSVVMSKEDDALDLNKENEPEARVEQFPIPPQDSEKKIDVDDNLIPSDNIPRFSFASPTKSSTRKSMPGLTPKVKKEPITSTPLSNGVKRTVNLFDDDEETSEEDEHSEYMPTPLAKKSAARRTTAAKKKTTELIAKTVKKEKSLNATTSPAVVVEKEQHKTESLELAPEPVNEKSENQTHEYENKSKANMSSGAKETKKTHKTSTKEPKKTELQIPDTPKQQDTVLTALSHSTPVLLPPTETAYLSEQENSPVQKQQRKSGRSRRRKLNDEEKATKQKMKLENFSRAKIAIARSPLTIEVSPSPRKRSIFDRPTIKRMRESEGYSKLSKRKLDKFDVRRE